MSPKNENLQLNSHKCITTGEHCNDCPGTDYCDEHKLAMAQLQALAGLPSSVSRMSGVLGVIGTLFTLIVGLLFNAHFESQKTKDMYTEKFDNISNQISKLDTEQNKAISAVKTDVLKLTLTVEQLQKQRENK